MNNVIYKNNNNEIFEFEALVIFLSIETQIYLKRKDYKNTTRIYYNY